MGERDTGGVSVLIVDDQRPFRMAAGAVVRDTGFRGGGRGELG